MRVLRRDEVRWLRQVLGFEPVYALARDHPIVKGRVEEIEARRGEVTAVIAANYGLFRWWAERTGTDLRSVVYVDRAESLRGKVVKKLVRLNGWWERVMALEGLERVMAADCEVVDVDCDALALRKGGENESGGGDWASAVGDPADVAGRARLSVRKVGVCDGISGLCAGVGEEVASEDEGPADADDIA